MCHLLGGDHIDLEILSLLSLKLIITRN